MAEALEHPAVKASSRGGIRGWGLLLALAAPLLVLFAWNRLEAESSRVAMERFDAWWSEDQQRFLQSLRAFFEKNGRPARPGEVSLAPFPTRSGVRSWAIQPDTVLRVELAAKHEGQVVILQLVPMVKGSRGVFYDCVSTTQQVRRACRGDAIGSVAAIPGQLAENARLIAQFAAGAGSSPDSGATSQSGSVVAMPTDGTSLESCGLRCVRPQACINPRPLACGRLVREGATSRYEISGTAGDHAASGLATLAEADRICESAKGPDAQIVRAGAIAGVATLKAGFEYWVHDDRRPGDNCWSSGPR